MKFEYDDEVDGLFIWFADVDREDVRIDGELWPAELGGNLGLLFDKSFFLVGLEIIFSSKFFDEKKSTKYRFYGTFG